MSPSESLELELKTTSWPTAGEAGVKVNPALGGLFAGALTVTTFVSMLVPPSLSVTLSVDIVTCRGR